MRRAAAADVGEQPRLPQEEEEEEAQRRGGDGEAAEMGARGVCAVKKK
jgi:hypothetical protein